MNGLNVFAQPEGPARTRAIAAWLQALYSQDDPPVLVGGSAVELYTDGAYVSGDLDFVGSVPEGVARALKEAGFVRKGRHWIYEKEEIFLEFPGSTLRPGEESRSIEGPGGAVWIISAEDLIVDRLLSLVCWGAREDGVNAALVYQRMRRELDRGRLRQRAEAEGVAAALRKLEGLFRKGAGPTPEEMLRFLKDAKGDSRP